MKIPFLLRLTVGLAFLILPGLRPLQAVTLRGLGDITPQAITASGLQGWSFQCDSPDHALILLHKIANDMSPTATVPVAWQTIHLGDSDVPVLIRQGFGSLLLVAKDSTVWAYTTTSTDSGALAGAFAPVVPTLAGAKFYDPQFRYPMYLDKFSSRGIGSWYPYNWGSKSPTNTIESHFDYLTAHDLTVQPNNDGFILRDILPFIHQYDRPYHFADWLGWTPELALLSPGDINQAGKDFTSMCTYYGEISNGGTKLLTYRNWAFEQTMKHVVNDPNLVDWLDPNGEVGPSAFQLYWDFSENNRRHFAEWLQNSRHYTLASLGKAWYGDAGRFDSWDAVPIPMNYELFGLQPDSIRPEPLWKVHSGKIDEGLAQGFAQPDHDDHGWLTLSMPGGQIPATLWQTQKPLWYRGVLDVSPGWLKAHRAAGRIYLNVATLTGSMTYEKPDHFWFNGQEVGALSLQPGHFIQGWIDVTEAVKAGANSVVFLPANSFWGPEGTVFLDSKPMENYPFTDSHLNARYFDWHEYESACIAEQMENTYKAIRGIDPNRYIKMHAAVDKDLVIPLQEKYGAYGHNTGDEAFFRPWDKRFGYPRGIPASAESSGSQMDAVRLKDWIGWSSFTGLNAFDNFHDVQSMMDPAVEPVWQEYLPYLHLANRRDLKKPDIALFSSSQNSRLLDRSLALCWDLGRGDLQPLGYSYVYTDESGLRDGLNKDYAVIWDTDTAIMQPETVARLKAYVEAGGTFVALQDTGRHTPLERDAWPIEDLTGFKVRETRPMTGTVNILHDQPLFTALAGKSFLNQGRGVDYSNYNYADKCVVLEPVAEDTQVIARYGDGGIAIGMRKLGKGRVVVLGSPFWRDSYDQLGVWWPGEGQDAFLEDILHGLGLKPLATADTHKVWREHYLANNGTEEYLALWNPYTDPVTFTTDWTTVHPAQSLYDPKNGQAVNGTINGNVVHLPDVTLAPHETLVVAAAVTRKPEEALQDWFAHEALWWRPSAPGAELKRPDLPVYTLPLDGDLQARQVSDTDLAGMDLAKLSTPADAGPGWSHDVGFSPDMQKSLPDTARFVFRVAFDLPASWKPGEPCQLNLRTFGKFGAVVDAYFNGTQVFKATQTRAAGYALDGGAFADVGSMLQFGKTNVLVLTTDKLGFMGNIELMHRPVPDESLPVTGPWEVQANEESGLAAQELPGTFTGLMATKRDVVVPSSWKGNRVFINFDLADPKQFSTSAINGQALFLPTRTFVHPVTYTDITPYVKFGQANTLTLIPTATATKFEPGTLQVNKITLERVANR